MSIVQIQCKALFDLYDVHQKADGGCATAVSAIAGEELGIALLEHYLRGTGTSAKRLHDKPTTGQSKGFRLDGWIATDKVLYQVEVKNWGQMLSAEKHTATTHNLGERISRNLFKVKGCIRFCIQ